MERREIRADCSVARQGCTVVVPYREEMAKRHLKPTGDLGRVVFIVCALPSWDRMCGSVLISVFRNTTCATPSRLRKAFAILTLCTTLLVVNIPPSEWRKWSGSSRADGLLMGRPCRNFSYADVNVDGIERIADATAKYDIDRFVHVSSYNADKNSASEYFATKVRFHNVHEQERTVITETAF